MLDEFEALLLKTADFALLLLPSCSIVVALLADPGGLLGVVGLGDWVRAWWFPVCGLFRQSAKFFDLRAGTKSSPVCKGKRHPDPP